MTADQAKAVAQSVGMQLQNEWMTTYKVIKAVPEDQKDYKPAGDSRSAGELAEHIASSDIWFLDGILSGSFGAPGKAAAADQSIEALADAYKHAFPQRLEAVLALEGHKHAEVLDFFGMKMPAVQLLVWTLTHMVHHRGQLSTYLRPMGSKVPNIYGGSFDEPFQG